MKLSEIFRVESIRTDLKTDDKTKAQVIHEMVEVLAKGYSLNKIQVQAISEAITYRERQKSTGMEKGVAIPHGKTEHVKGLSAALGIYKEGVEFDSLDRKPSHFVVLMVSDFTKSTEHVQALAQVMRILQRDRVAKDVLNAKDAQAVYKVICDES